MITIIHGDNVIQSRAKLIEVKSQLKTSDADILSLDGSKLNLITLMENVESNNLFVQEKSIIIENLFSNKSKTNLKEIVQYLSQTSDLPDLIIWQGKNLTATQLKPFTKATIHVFKPTSELFKFLEIFGIQTKNIQLQLLHRCIESDSAELVFFMLSRQVRNMLLALGNNLKGPTWLTGKTKSQANKIGLVKLLKLHQLLVDFDYKLKTSQNIIGLETELAIFLLNE